MPTPIKKIHFTQNHDLAYKVNLYIQRGDWIAKRIMGEENEDHMQIILENKWIEFDTSLVLFQASDPQENLAIYIALKCQYEMIDHVDSDGMKDIEQEFLSLLYQDQPETSDLFEMIEDFTLIMNCYPLVDEEQQVWNGDEN